MCLAGLIGARTGGQGRPALAWVEAPAFDGAAWLRGGERFTSGAAIHISDAAGARLLLPNFMASADPAVSPDGARLLVAGRRTAGDRWQVFEVAIQGGGEVRQITAGEGDFVRPFYLAEQRVVYTRILNGNSWIESAPLAGGAAERLTFSGAPVLTDGVLRDGRILFETQFRGNGGAARDIMTVYPDGTGVEAVRCDHGGDRHSAREIAAREIVFAESGRLARFTPALAHETELAAPAGEFDGPAEALSNGEWIAAMRPNAASRYRLVGWRAGARAAAQVVIGDNANALEPVALAAHDAPTRFPSALVASRTWLNLLCLDARTSRDRMQAGIAGVRVFTQGDHGEERLLGQTAVEEDGSFFVQVPGDRPVRMEVLNAAGRVLRGEKNWWWGRRAEQRVCVGCHAGPEHAPENAVPVVLLRKDVPVSMLAPTDGGRR